MGLCVRGVTTYIYTGCQANKEDIKSRVSCRRKRRMIRWSKHAMRKKNLQIPGRRAVGGKAEAAAVHCSVLVVLIVGTTIETNSLYSIMYIEFVFCTY